MAWRGWVGPWPGRGPFSYLPPWYRPGWWFGRGRGRRWWFFNPHVWGVYGYSAYSPYLSYGPYPPSMMCYRRRPYGYYLPYPYSW